MKTVGLRMGEFPRAIIGAFDFKGEDFQANSTYFGLHLHETYLIARFTWEDSGKLSMSGRLLGPGMQTYVPSHRDRLGTGVCHTGTFYEGEGSGLGEPVSGIL